MDRLRPSQLVVLAALVCALVAGLWSSAHPAGTKAMAFSRPDGAGELRMASATVSSAGAETLVPRSAGDALEAMDASRRLVRNATLSIEIGRFADAAERAGAIAGAHGGFVADARSSREDEGESGTLTLRVPAASFDAALRELKALGRVQSSAIETQDVTKEYADLEARLAAKRDAEARLREIMQRRTAGLADLVAAEQERTRLIEEIEKLEGERRYLQRRVSYATIALELREPSAFLRAHAFAPLRDAARRALPLLAASIGLLISVASAALPWIALGLIVWSVRRRFETRRSIRIATQD